MKPAHSILDESFRYVPAVATSVTETWRRFGWRPISEEERRRQRRPARQECSVRSGQPGAMMDRDQRKGPGLAHENLHYIEEANRAFTIMQIFHLIDRILLEQGHGQTHLNAVLAIFTEPLAIARDDVREASHPRLERRAAVSRRAMLRAMTDDYVVSGGHATKEST
jgi:hypothetical protein